MIKIEFTFETPEELHEFCRVYFGDNQMVDVEPEKQKAPAKENKKPPKRETKVVRTEATQDEVRKAVKEFAMKHDPNQARKFLESRGVSNVSSIKDDPEEYGAVLEALKKFEEDLKSA